MFLSSLEIHKQPADESTNRSVVINLSSLPRKDKVGQWSEDRGLPPAFRGSTGSRRVVTAEEAVEGGRGCKIDPMVSVIAPRVRSPHAVAHNGVRLGDVL